MGKKINKAMCVFGARFLLEQVQRFHNDMDGALIGNDIEHVHRLRVSSRRLRNGFDIFKECLPGKKFQAWQDEIKRTTHALGSARDLDIQIDLLKLLFDEILDEKFRPGIMRLQLRLSQQRVETQTKVNNTIIKLREERILKRIEGRLTKLSAGSEDIYLYTPSLYQRAFISIHDRLVEFLSYQEDVQSPENINKLHAMRIEGKKLRYTLEIFMPIYDKALPPYIRLMKGLQDQLGVIHDCDVWVSWLPKFIDQEQSRIEDYFGNSEPLEKLLPGIHYLIENRKAKREKEYQSFIATLNILKQENTWERLQQIIKAPINIEAAVAHFKAEDNVGNDDTVADDNAMTEE